MQIQQLPFDTKDIVYAKIGNYPWWPGKIIQIGEHKCQIFYKISFYNDSTYCYVKQDDLILYEKFDCASNKSYQINNQLKKAIEMANNAFNKKKCLKIRKILSQQIEENIVNSKQVNTDSNNKQIQMNQQIQICIQIQKPDQKIDQIRQVEQIQKVQLLSPKIQDTQQSTMFYTKQSFNQIDYPYKISSFQQKQQQMYNLLKQYKLDNIPKYIQKIKQQTLPLNITIKSIQEINISNNEQLSEQNLSQLQQSQLQNIILKQKKPEKFLKNIKRSIQREHKNGKYVQMNKIKQNLSKSQLKYLYKKDLILKSHDRQVQKLSIRQILNTKNKIKSIYAQSL